MDLPGPQSTDERIRGGALRYNPPEWPPMRRHLLEWFRENAASLAEAYEGALWLLEAVRFPGRVHFVAHAVRDIADRLVFVLDGHLEGSRVQYEQKLDQIGVLWPELRTLRQDGRPADIAGTVSINNSVVSLIDDLVKAHRDRRQRPSNSELLFRFLMRNEPSRAEVNDRLVADFKGTREWFMSLTHLRHKQAPQVDESELQRQFAKFEGMLYSFVGDFFAVIAELDDALQHANK